VTASSKVGRPIVVAAAPSWRTKLVAILLLALAAAVLVITWAALGLDLAWLAIALLAVHALWLHRDRFTVRGDADEARADAHEAHNKADRALSTAAELADAIEVPDDDGPSTGRHARITVSPTSPRSPA
jgi:hypothetical protein